METTLRHWHMLQLLPRYPRQTDAGTITRSLNDRGFGISKRTVERDLAHLSRVFPLQCDSRSLPFGWAWARGGETFDIPCMDMETALSFAVLDRFASHLLPPNVSERIGPHVERAGQILNEMATGQGGQAWPDRVRVLSRSFGLLAPEVDARVADVVYQSLLTERCFEGTYHSRSGENGAGKVFEVHPQGLVFRDQIAYVVATLWAYCDIRQLALHRFSKATILEKSRAEIEGFDLDAYIAEGHFYICEGRDDLRVHLRFTSDAAYHLAETPLAADQELRPRRDGATDLRATVHNTAQLRWWLLGFGDAVQVVRPQSLRRELAEVLHRAARQYND